MKRYDYIDLAKGIGIFLVVLGHATLKNDYVTSYIYSFHMPLFFVIAGMLLCATKSYEGAIKPVLIGKLRTLMLPYLFFSIIYTAIDLIRHDLYAKTNAVFSVCLQGSGPLWFLPTLFLSEIIFILLLKYSGKIKGIIAALIIGSAAFYINSLFYFDTDVIIRIKDANLPLICLRLVSVRSMCCLVFLCAGFGLMALMPYIKSNCISVISGTVLLLIPAIPVFISYRNGAEPYISNMTYMEFNSSVAIYILCALCGSAGLLMLCKGLEGFFSLRFIAPVGKLLRFWGKNSLLIMVTHLNCQILFLGNLFAAFMNQYITHARDYIFLFNVMAVCMLTESLLILPVNRFIPWILGKKKAQSQ